jgi:hypothetical protein
MENKPKEKSVHFEDKKHHISQGNDNLSHDKVNVDIIPDTENNKVNIMLCSCNVSLRCTIS